MKKYISSLILFFLFFSAFAGEQDILVMHKMVERLFPNHSASFEFHASDKFSTDCFELESIKNKIVITGNNANSMAVGLNYYLRNNCLTTVSWYKNDPIELPDNLPIISSKITIESNVPNRFFLNYCTFGYTMTWWKWSDWERFIDWMALNGVNMPLAITGQESIWYNVWTKLGLSDEEIRNYFTGPAYLPWHRMCNLDGWQGPLPKEWLENQEKLQEKIVSREREFNMRPVLPAFNGHVPEALKRIYPHAEMTQVSKWGGFADEYRCTYLNPMDSLFSVIQKEYLTEQTRLFGTDHIYGIDPFNEVDPPSWNADSLGIMSRHIYESVSTIDHQAIWLQMSWIFYADPEHWTTPRIKSYLEAVPQNKLMLLDYFCENTESWKKTESFFGQPYIWCYLGNFGGNSMLSGPCKLVSERLSNVLKNGGTNLKGVGSTLEGLDLNQFMYEFVLDKAWKCGQTDDEWFRKLADRRFGEVSKEAREAWKILSEKVYVQSAIAGQGTLTNARPCLKGNDHWTTKPTIEYQRKDLIEAWHILLSAKGSKRDSYEFDVINLGRQVLGDYFNVVRDEFTQAHEKKEIVKMKEKGLVMKEILSDMDKLVACHPTFSLYNWISDARDMGNDEASKKYYEVNARSLVSIWGDSFHLTDYANRSWAGLTKQYYAARWIRFIDEVIAATETGETFNEKSFYKKSLVFENEWAKATNTISYYKDREGIKVARSLYNKYKSQLIN